MTYGAFTPQDFPTFEGPGRSRQPISPAVLCALALCASTAVGLWLLYGRPSDSSQIQAVDVVAGQAAAPVEAPPLRRDTATVPALPPTPAPTTDATGNVAPHIALRRDAALLNPTFASGYKPVTFAQSAPLRSAFEPLRQRMPGTTAPIQIPVAALLPSPVAPSPVSPSSVSPSPAAPSAVALSAASPVTPPAPIVAELDQDVPLPAPRPADLLRPRASPLPVRTALAAPSPAAAAPAAPEHSSFFDRLFRPAAPNPGGTILAYAAPEDGGIGQNDRVGRPLPYDRWTAVYVISTHTVYLPDGTQLEAHSGLGASLDDPRSVAERMRGATPPNVYDLQEREALFHGVRALRLNPSDANGTYGRGGLLAHTFMLGPRGDSNGCVVFRNYKAFLQAYDTGAIRRLAVVARLN